MNARLLYSLVFCLSTSYLCAQTAVRLPFGGKVENTVIYNNPDHSAVSEGVVVVYSASDSLLPAGSGNILLESSPFMMGFQIGAFSSLRKGGFFDILDIFDTFDVIGNPRVSCNFLDIGAYQFQTLETRILSTPRDLKICDDEIIDFVVQAEGVGLRYQWQILDEEGDWLDWWDVSQANSPGAKFSITDTGTYRMLIFGDCGDDLVTSSIRLEKDICEFDVLLDGTHPGCADGEGWIRVIAIGRTGPYTYRWSHNPSLMGNEATGLPHGVYIVTVTDVLGVSITRNFRVERVSLPIIMFEIDNPRSSDCDGGNIRATVTPGTGTPFLGPGKEPYLYEWCNGHIRANMENVLAGTYVLTVTDSLGCLSTAGVELQCLFRHVMPTVFISPNNDGRNDYLHIENIEYYPKNRVTIIDSYGNEIITITGYNNVDRVWSGQQQNRSRQVPDGVYYYIVDAEGVDPMAGWVLVRMSSQR